MAILYSVLSMMNILTELFPWSLMSSVVEVFSSLTWVIKLILAFTGVYGIVLYSLLIESELSGSKRWIRGCLQFLNLAFFMLSFNLAGVYTSLRIGLMAKYMQLFALAFYAVLAVVFCWPPGK